MHWQECTKLVSHCTNKGLAWACWTEWLRDNQALRRLYLCHSPLSTEEKITNFHSPPFFFIHVIHLLFSLTFPSPFRLLTNTHCMFTPHSYLDYISFCLRIPFNSPSFSISVASALCNNACVHSNFSVASSFPSVKNSLPLWLRGLTAIVGCAYIQSLHPRTRYGSF